jgi:hypothetical protein
MKTLSYQIQIKATPEKIWEKMWLPENYSIWTKAFCAGNYYKTASFTEGSAIHLLTPDGHGMYSVLETIIEHKYLAFKHIGDIINFEEIPISQQSESWSGAMETYTLDQKDNEVLLTVKVDTTDSYVNSMNKLFPSALNDLKLICENYDTNHLLSKTL